MKITTFLFNPVLVSKNKKKLQKSCYSESSSD